MIEGATYKSESFLVGQMGPYGFEENAVSWDVRLLRDGGKEVDYQLEATNF